ncbi:bifunctional nuclease family protein [Microbacterium kribbense]|uniref:Bifunctional nuclease family protein n=1 Tax=Microbacterium kribbense TaxID=433645 RepID=A0ABP7G1I5_9MICO
MVEVRVTGIALDPSGAHVILLEPVEPQPGGRRMLPIWIGQLEATSIMTAIEGAEMPRPLTHDLLATIVHILGASVEMVEITRIDDGTFYAEITLNAAGGIQRIDSRPSDAVAIATRCSAPIFVADEVLAAAGVDNIITAGEGGEADADADVEEFSKFLDQVDPDDFKE